MLNEEEEMTPLTRAIELGSLEDVERELQQGGDLTARDRWGRTPWLLAVCTEDIAKAELLQAYGAKTDVRGRCGATALMYAADDAPMLRWLISQGADVREPNDFGETALHDAAAYGVGECCRLLLAAGAEACAENHVKAQPISNASTSEIVQILVDAGADINFICGQGYYRLRQAAEDEDVEMVRALLAMGASPDPIHAGETALHAAVRANEMEIMRLLLAAGADPNAQDYDRWGTLWYAETTEAVQILLAAGANVHLVNNTGHEALQKHTNIEIQAQLIRAGCFVNPPNPRSGTPLLRATEKDSIEQIQFLLSQGADVNAATGWGETALMAAAVRSFAGGVQLLLAAGASVEAQDANGRTALFYAAAPEAFTAYTLAQDMNKKDWRTALGENASEEVINLMEARSHDLGRYGYVESDSLEALQLLIQAGVNVNARDTHGLTPLMLTASCGRPARVAGLLALGADLTLRDPKGNCAYDYAEMHPDREQRAAILTNPSGTEAPSFMYGEEVPPCPSCEAGTSSDGKILKVSCCVKPLIKPLIRVQ